MVAVVVVVRVQAVTPDPVRALDVDKSPERRRVERIA